MSFRAWLTVGAVGAAHAIAPLHLRAQVNPDAEEAAQLVKQKRYPEAIEKFKAADAAAPDPAYDCKIGIIYAELEKYGQARMFVDRCSERNNGVIPDAHLDRVKLAEKKINKGLAQKGYGPVVFHVEPAGASVHVGPLLANESFVPPLPRRVWLPAGEHAYRVEAAGMQPAAGTVTVVAGKTAVDVKVALTPIATHDPVATDPRVDGDSDDGHTSLDPPPEDPPPVDPLAADPSRTDPIATPTRRDVDPAPSRGAAPWISLAVGAVGIGVGITFTVMALDTRDQAAKDAANYDDLIDRMRREEVVFWTGYGVGAAAVALSIYLFTRDAERPKSTSAAPSIDVGPRSVLVRWTF